MQQATPPKVFITTRESECDECGEELGRKAWITLAGERGAVPCVCRSGPSSSARGRHGRDAAGSQAFGFNGDRAQVEPGSQAVRTARVAGRGGGVAAGREGVSGRRRGPCPAVRGKRNIAGARRTIRRPFCGPRAAQLYPKCPAGRETIIAEHACQKYSGRVGRSALAKNLADEAVDLAVTAHIRHAETKYDQLLRRYWDRSDARAGVAEEVAEFERNGRGRMRRISEVLVVTCFHSINCGNHDDSGARFEFPQNALTAID